jgi:hypothetical protein
LLNAPGLNRLMGHQTISSWFIYRPFLLTFLSDISKTIRD